MATTGKTIKKPKRATTSYEPKGAIKQMLNCELRRFPARQRGVLKSVLDAAVVAHLGPKYPKLLVRYQQSITT